MISRFTRFLIAVFVICQWSHAALVAIQETVVQAKAITSSEKDYLTDELRKQASQILPSKHFTIMTRENVRVLLKNGKSLEDCEGSCAVETGRNLSADYITNTTVSTMDGQLTLTIQLYNVNNTRLLGSYTTRRYDVDGLLADIEQNAADLFEKIIKDSGLEEKNVEGISNIKIGKSTMGAPFVNRYILKLNSDPNYAKVLVDNQDEDHCLTPCLVEVDEGKHRLHFSKELYKNKDTIITVKSSRELSVNLNGDFGVLKFNPQLGMYGDRSDISITLDGVPVKSDRETVASGTHLITIKHPCYTTKKIKVEISANAEKNINPTLTPAKGTLDAQAYGGKTPILFINDKEIAMLPYRGEVDVCADIAIERADNYLKLDIQENKVTSYLHKTTFTDQRDGREYNMVKIGNQTWMAENLDNTTCPEGWRLPSNRDFEILEDYIGPYASRRLRTTEDWGGTDQYGFSVKPNKNQFKTRNGYCEIGIWSQAIECENTESQGHIRCIKDTYKSDDPIQMDPFTRKALSFNIFAGASFIGDGSIIVSIPAGIHANIYLGQYLQASIGPTIQFASSEYDYEGDHNLDENKLGLTLKAGLTGKSHRYRIGFMMEKYSDIPLLFGGYLELFDFSFPLGELSIVTNSEVTKVAITYGFDIFVLPW